MKDGTESKVGDDRLNQALEMAKKGISGEMLRIHMIAVGGTGMAPLACLLAELGHEVVGSDMPLYPPMSELIADAGIVPLVGFEANHLEQPRQPDLVIVGNAVPRHNEEVQATERLGLPRMSMPEAVGHFLLEKRRPLVATGTHGKTTTSAMAAWVLKECGADPGYLIGGAPIGLDASFNLGSGSRFVIEGDEYNAAYFDRGPKFLHYRAQTVTLTSVEYDHVDLYPSAESFRSAFVQLAKSMPTDGLLVACADTAEVREVATQAGCAVQGYSAKRERTQFEEPFAQVVRPVDEPTVSEQGTRFVIEHKGARYPVQLQLWGEHNIANALAVWCAVVGDGFAPAQVARALSSFSGVRRRLEVLGVAEDVVVVDDFAHHPTEVAASLKALRSRYPKRRLVALFEPRSLSACRAAFADAYQEAFSPADVVLFAPVFHANRLDVSERLDLDDLCGRLGRVGVKASAQEDYQAVIATAKAVVRPQDVVVTMSSGAFGGAPRRLLEQLKGR